uniref:ATP synthase F0 subunit 8 n=1 Tax=Aleeta curvicosta TaxID=1218668 RepID=A0A3Q8GAY0_9HEMI|nr:ATP synthase F0 subunit 8 [Aleeta curvicosta]
MPQMSPMNWCFLFFFFLLIVMLMITFIYFFFIILPKTNLTKNFNNPSLYTWMW